MKSTQRRARLTAFLIASTLASSVANDARAETENPRRTRVTLDIDYALALGEGDTDKGAGGTLRLGHELDLATVALTPEVGLAYHGFDGSRSPSIYRAFIGARSGFGGLLEPSLYARIGVAHANEDDGSRTVPSFGAGLALDFTPIPMLDLGVHSGYELLFSGGDEDAFDWWVFGGHAGFVF